MVDSDQHPSIPSPVLPPDLDDFTYEQIETKEQIGTGGDANVYRGIVSQDDVEYTIAVKKPRFEGTIQQEVVEDFQHEAETWNKLDDHSNVVTVYSWGEKPFPWLGLEYMDGETLESYLGNLTIEEALWLAGRIAEGIQEGHRHGVVHLDLKPSNVLLRETPDEKFPYPKVSDWGLAKFLLDHSKSVEGLSPTYAAPEQFDNEEYGQTDNLTDIYQFGTILYALCTGEPPFTGSATSVMQSVLNEEPTLPSEHNPKISNDLDDILLKALSKEKEHRYESIVILRKALDKQFNEYTDTGYKEIDSSNDSTVSSNQSTDTLRSTSNPSSHSEAESGTTIKNTTSSTSSAGTSQSASNPSSRHEPTSSGTTESNSLISRRTTLVSIGAGIIGISAVGVVQSGTFQQITSAENRPTDEGEQLQPWNIQIDSKHGSDPLIDQGNVYYADNNGTIYATNIESGEGKWSKQFNSSVPNDGLSKNDSQLIVVSEAGSLRSINKNTGDVEWERVLQLTPKGVVWDNKRDLIYTMSLSGAEYRIGGYSSDGDQKWSVSGGSESSDEAPGEIHIDQATDNIVASTNTGIVTVDATSGSKKWAKPFNGYTKNNDKNIRLYVNSIFTDLGGGRPAAVNINDGSIVWQNDLNSPDPGVIAGIHDDNIIYANFDGIWSFDSNTGKTKWTSGQSIWWRGAHLFNDGLYGITGADNQTKLNILNANNGVNKSERVLSDISLESGKASPPLMSRNHLILYYGSSSQAYIHAVPK